jgi:hypothetical protein
MASGSPAVKNLCFNFGDKALVFSERSRIRVPRGHRCRGGPPPEDGSGPEGLAVTFMRCTALRPGSGSDAPARDPSSRGTVRARCSERIRRHSRMTRGWSWQRWPPWTISSEAAPSSRALAQGTTPSVPPSLGGSRRSARIEWYSTVGSIPKCVKGKEPRMSPRQLVDAGGQPLSEGVMEEIGFIRLKRTSPHLLPGS